MKPSALVVIALVLTSCRKEEDRTDLVLSATCIQCHVSVAGSEETITDFIPGTVRNDHTPVDTVPGTGRYNFNAIIGSAYSIRAWGGSGTTISIVDNGVSVRSEAGSDISLNYVAGSGH